MRRLSIALTFISTDITTQNFIFTFCDFPTSDSYKRYAVTLLRCYGLGVYQANERCRIIDGYKRQ